MVASGLKSAGLERYFCYVTKGLDGSRWYVSYRYRDNSVNTLLRVGTATTLSTPPGDGVPSLPPSLDEDVLEGVVGILVKILHPLLLHCHCHLSRFTPLNILH